MSNLLVGTCQELKILLHGSAPKAVASGVSVNVRAKSEVGEGSGVSLGMDVWVAVAVGGTIVSIGLASCVIAITVNAAAIEVLSISSWLMDVGVAGAPQELTSKVSNIRIIILNFIPGKIP